MVSLGIFIVTSLRRRCKRGGVAGEPVSLPPSPSPTSFYASFKANFEMRGGLKIVSDTDSVQNGGTVQDYRCQRCRRVQTKNCNHFFKDLSRTTFDFQGPPMKNVSHRLYKNAQSQSILTGVYGLNCLLHQRLYIFQFTCIN